MTDWMWMLALFIGASLTYWAGVALGMNKNDRAPNANVWLNIRKYSVDMNKECALREMELNHEEQMALIERGAFDVMKGEEEEGEEDDSD